MSIQNDNDFDSSDSDEDASEDKDQVENIVNPRLSTLLSVQIRGGNSFTTTRDAANLTRHVSRDSFGDIDAYNLGGVMTINELER